MYFYLDSPGFLKKFQTKDGVFNSFRTTVEVKFSPAWHGADPGLDSSLLASQPLSFSRVEQVGAVLQLFAQSCAIAIPTYLRKR